MSIRPTKMSTQPMVSSGGGGTGGAVASVMGMFNTAKEKWDASGANEAFARASASIPDSTKAYVTNMFNREHLRSIYVCFGIGEERPFYIEKIPSLLMERLRHNFSFFYLNYMLVTAILFCLTLLISPSAIIGIALLAGAWMWVIRASQSGALNIGSISIPQKTATIGMAGISVFVLLWLLSSIFWWTLFSSGFLIGLHALFRDASMHKDMDDAVAMEGDFQGGPSDLHLGEDAAFLNSGAQVNAV